MRVARKHAEQLEALQRELQEVRQAADSQLRAMDAALQQLQGGLQASEEENGRLQV